MDIDKSPIVPKNCLKIAHGYPESGNIQFLAIFKFLDRSIGLNMVATQEKNCPGEISSNNDQRIKIMPSYITMPKTIQANTAIHKPLILFRRLGQY